MTSATRISLRRDARRTILGRAAVSGMGGGMGADPSSANSASTSRSISRQQHLTREHFDFRA